MPRSSPTAKNKQRAAAAASKYHETSAPTLVQLVTIEQSVQHPVVTLQEPRPATPIQRTRKRVGRRPKYHETPSFLERESCKGLAPTDGLPPPGPHTSWFPGTTLGESYRVASTMFRAAHQASLETQPVSWGYGYTDGALGHSNTRRVVGMKQLVIFRRAIIRAVSAGNRLSLFLTDDNRVFQSGRLFMKQDGCAMWEPIEIKMDGDDFLSSKVKIVAVEAGHLAAYALDDQARLYSWGTQIFGQLGHGEELEQETGTGEGNGDTSIEGENPGAGYDEEEMNKDEEDEDTEPQPKTVIVERTPRLVEGLAGHPIVKISAGNHFVVVVSTSGEVFAWGRGCFGQLGNGQVADVSAPVLVEALKGYAALDIAAGMSHVLGVFVPKDESCPSTQEAILATERTVVMTWGRGTHGCLGLGGANNELLPRENPFFRGLGALKVAAGADHSMVLCGAGATTFLYAFGGNQLGQLGIASSSDHVDMPSFLDEFINVHVAEIGAGAQYSASLTGDGEIFTWGDARYGKTCRADGRTTYVPWNVDLPRTIPSSSFITQLSVGSHHSLAQVRINGQVDRWRKFPLNGIVAAMSHEENSDKASLCQCKSSQTTTRCVLGIFVQCETCQVSPLCRVCSRRCHAGHTLGPLAGGRGLHRVCSCSDPSMSSRTSCLFASKLPSTIPEEGLTKVKASKSQNIEVDTCKNVSIMITKIDDGGPVSNCVTGLAGAIRCCASAASVGIDFFECSVLTGPTPEVLFEADLVEHRRRKRECEWSK